MIEREMDKITKDDVDLLVTMRRVEDRQLEYKSQLPGNSDKDKREFLADVSAFANAAGGDILYGVDEETGVPKLAHGLSLSDFDAERSRLQNMIREGIQPRIPLVEIKAIEGFTDGPIVVLRVTQSWRAPHMVTYAGSSRFYVRDAGQRHMMDVQELRAAFVGSDSLAARLRDFRDERLARVLGRSTPIPVVSAPTMVLHVVPIGNDFVRGDIDPRRVGDHWLKLISTEFVQGANNSINLEGFLLYSTPDRAGATESPSYIQLFRNGAVEAVATLRPNQNGHYQIEGPSMERQIVKAVDALRVFRGDIGIGGTVLVFLTLLRFQSVALFPAETSISMGRGFGRETILLPEVVIDQSATANTGQVLRPIFDIVWQAAGFKGSYSYNTEGDWAPRQTRD